MPRKSNWLHRRAVYEDVNRRAAWAISLLFAATLGAAYSDYVSAKQKFDLIESDRLRAGSRVDLSLRELNERRFSSPTGRRWYRSTPISSTRRA